MKLLAAFLAMLLCASSAWAQSTTRPTAIIVPTCGTPPNSGYATTGSEQRTVMDANGNTCGTATISGAIPAGTNIIGQVGIDQTTPGTTNGVRVNAALPAGTNNIGLVDPTGVTAIAPVVSASLENAHVLKNAAGRLYSAYASSLTGGTGGNLLIFDATSAPVDGAVTPKVCVPFNSNGLASANYQGIPPAAFAVGITAVVSSAPGCLTKTTGVTTAFISGLVAAP